MVGIRGGRRGKLGKSQKRKNGDYWIIDSGREVLSKALTEKESAEMHDNAKRWNAGLSLNFTIRKGIVRLNVWNSGFQQSFAHHTPHTQTRMSTRACPIPYNTSNVRIECSMNHRLWCFERKHHWGMLGKSSRIQEQSENKNKNWMKEKWKKFMKGRRKWKRSWL